MQLNRPKSEFKALQVNCRAAKSVHIEVNTALESTGFDLAFLQEPYGTFYGRQRSSDSTLWCKDCPPGYIYYTPKVTRYKVGIMVKRSRFQAFHLVKYDSEHLIALNLVDLVTGFKFIAISLYCQFSLSLDPMLVQLERVVCENAGSEMMLCTDANAKSPLWYSDWNDRGRDLAEFFVMHGFIVANQPVTDRYTYEEHGMTNIDVTAVTTKLGSCVVRWTITNHVLGSDHSSIVIDIDLATLSSTVRSNSHNGCQFNFNKTDWCLYVAHLREKIDDLDDDANVDSYLSDVNSMIQEGIRLSTPYKGSVNERRSVPWWSDELTLLRKRVSRARKSLNRRRRLQLPYDEEKRLYLLRRNTYNSLIKKSKWRCWSDFLNNYGVERDRPNPWGFIHKVAKKGSIGNSTFGSLEMPDGSFTKSWSESAHLLASRFFPKDTFEGESAYHRNICKSVDRYSNSNVEAPFSGNEVSGVINNLKKKKAPGLDGVRYEHVIVLWKVRPKVLINLFNKCLYSAVFPEPWKKGNLVVIPKGKGSNASQPGSYRPITLLNVLGKVFEKLVISRIESAYIDNNLDCTLQYGFKCGLSSEDALKHTLGSIKSATSKYVACVFVDIQGAFDNLWWPGIFKRVMLTGCSSTLLNVVRTYFSERVVVLGSEGMHEKVECFPERGCPQGSIIGPSAWRWCMDELLQEVSSLWHVDSVEWVAYADDICIIVKEDSRLKIEEMASSYLSVLQQWCCRYKLRVSGSKTKCCLVKGNLHRARMPRIFNGSDRLECVGLYKYLGVVIDSKLTFVEHTRRLRTRVITYLMCLRRHVGNEWGIRRGVLEILYKTVCLPVVEYGSCVWLEHTHMRAHVKRQLMAMQRMGLMLISRGCRLCATESLQIVTGILPVDFELYRRATKRSITKGVACSYKEFRYEGGEEDKADAVDRLEEYLDSCWQDRWSASTAGRNTFKFIPQVTFAKCNPWFRPSRLCVYILTGYGGLRYSAFQRTVGDTGFCPICTEDETVEHFIFKCIGYNSIRPSLFIECIDDWKELITTESNYALFAKYVVEAFRIREPWAA